MKFDLLVVGETVLFGEEGGAQGGLVVVVELLVGEAGEDGGLAHSRIAHRNQLQLRHLPLFLVHSRHPTANNLLSLMIFQSS
jgi:hypothetical protein